MKLRITYRKQAADIEITVDTDINNQQIYAKVFDNEQLALKAIENILKSAEVDLGSIQPPIEIAEEFGSFTFDVGLDFSKEDDYKKFCDSLILDEMSQKTTGVEGVK